MHSFLEFRTPTVQEKNILQQQIDPFNNCTPKAIIYVKLDLFHVLCFAVAYSLLYSEEVEEPLCHSFPMFWLLY